MMKHLYLNNLPSLTLQPYDLQTMPFDTFFELNDKSEICINPQTVAVTQKRVLT